MTFRQGVQPALSYATALEGPREGKCDPTRLPPTSCQDSVLVGGKASPMTGPYELRSMSECGGTNRRYWAQAMTAGTVETATGLILLACLRVLPMSPRPACLPACLLRVPEVLYPSIVEVISLHPNYLFTSLYHMRQWVLEGVCLFASTSPSRVSV